MKAKKITITKIILLLVLMNLFQFFGYVNPFTRFTVVSITNEETAIAQARIGLRAWGMPIEGYVFTGEFSWRARSWVVSVSSSNNVYDVIHYMEFSAISGRIIREDIN